jgi:hypothetical protein
LGPQDYGLTAVRDLQNILPLKEQLSIMERLLEWRLDHLIPDLMRRERIDMWLIISSGEYHRIPPALRAFLGSH